MSHRAMFAAALAAALAAPPLSADDAPGQHNPAGHWNQFRGARGDGHADSSKLPVEWSESKNVAWKTAIHGRAWSSPVVWKDQVWLTSAAEDGRQLSALCIDALTGKVVHDLTVFDIEKPQFCYPYNTYASATPVVEEGRLWAHYGSAGTACLDTATGKTLWTRQDLPCNHHRGHGSSPVVFDDLLILTFDGFDQQYLVALDKATGKTVWKKDRDIQYGTDNGDVKKSYSTPAIFRHAGRVQLVSPASIATVAYDPLTGNELWKAYHGGFNAAARPLYGHGLVYLSLEGGERLLAVRPDGAGDVTKTHIAWKTMKSTPSRPSQLLVGDEFYMVTDNGVVSCLDAKTGEQRWTHRIGGPHDASPLFVPASVEASARRNSADDAPPGRIYFFDQDKHSRVLEASPREFKLLADNELETGCMASPAVHGDALILRTKTHLYRIAQP